MHAWNLDLETGQVIDLTWRHPEQAYYWGMIIPNETAMQLMLHHGVYGVLASDYRLDVPLLRYGELIPPDGLPHKNFWAETAAVSCVGRQNAGPGWSSSSCSAGICSGTCRSRP
jgi:hypothetical protein